MSTFNARICRTSPLPARLSVAVVLALLTLDEAPVSMHAQASGPAGPQAQAQAQTQTQTQNQVPGPSTVTLEVASIRRNKPAEDERATLPPGFPATPARAQTLPGRILRGRGMSVKEIIRDAYGYRNRAHGEVVGAPKWVDEERYDIEARANQEFPASTSLGLPPAGEAALQALLADRFKLKARRDSAVRPVYELVLRRADGRLGPNLVPSKGGCRSFFQREAVNAGLVILEPGAGQPQPLRPCPLGVGPTGISAENMPMSDWVRILSMRPQLNRTVIDRTGLTGGYDITLTYFDPSEPLRLDPFQGVPLPPLKPLLESQMGLTLREAEAVVEILVIESIERPSEN
jgi:uncharacterized protein (TIGR03435 family)